MGGIPLLKVTRCCCCTRKLKVACVLISIWSMWATSHSIRILFRPACCKQYTEEGGEWHQPLTIVMWTLFLINLLTLCSSFLFLLGLFLGYRFSADLFMLFGFMSGCTMIVHAVYTILQLIDSDCKDASDAVAHIIYGLLWFYFIVIVNSHRDNI